MNVCSWWQDHASGVQGALFNFGHCADMNTGHRVAEEQGDLGPCSFESSPNNMFIVMIFHILNISIFSKSGMIII